MMSTRSTKNRKSTSTSTSTSTIIIIINMMKMTRILVGTLRHHHRWQLISWNCLHSPAPRDELKDKLLSLVETNWTLRCY
mmetsp:Transcript_119562/g.211282  ORF Transcript_119562/g.211282 Transcript_119562/m.211282 type:complete len:80 (+) Transcript_119562:140-379(+)